MIQGHYGQRIIEHVRAICPDDWVVSAINIPKNLPILIDEPEEFLPSVSITADLVLALIESEGAAQLTPTLTAICEAKAVIVPVDNPSWLRPGLQNQLKEELIVKGIDSIFPRTFCTLTEHSVGFRGKVEHYDSAIISEFAMHFGCPKLEITTNTLTEKIVSITVKRGAPCGSTNYVADQLVGLSVRELIPKAGLMVHQFPCLAGMQLEEIDNGIQEPFMNISGHKMNDEIKEVLQLDSTTVKYN